MIICVMSTYPSRDIYFFVWLILTGRAGGTGQGCTAGMMAAIDGDMKALQMLAQYNPDWTIKVSIIRYSTNTSRLIVHMWYIYRIGYVYIWCVCLYHHSGGECRLVMRCRWLNVMVTLQLPHL